MSKTIFKSTGAVVAGFLAIVVLATSTDTALARIGVFPPPDKSETYATWMFCVAVVYRTVFSVCGGFIAGRLAPRDPMKPVLVLAVVGALIGVVGVVTGWDLPGYPHWYAIALAALTFPSVWCGGKLVSRKPARSEAAAAPSQP
ncbi:MAG: hypothetical protein HZB13_00995 [Acidobacteria bacterium]|nr:hypothetical protein [Acidobacteriota bacterium]